MTEDDLLQWFDNYEKALEDYKINPKLLFNFDETMLDERDNKKKVASEKDQDPPPDETPPEAREHVTLLLNCTASGHFFKPTVIVPLVTLPHLDQDVKDYYHIAGSEKGWITSEILRTTIAGTFLAELTSYKTKHKLEGEWTMILVDNHSSREIFNDKKFNEDILVANRIVIWNLLPHSSHITQPLDLSPNLRFKLELGRLKKNNDEELSKLDLQEYRNKELLYSIRALSIGLSQSAILDGWERTGLWVMGNPGGTNRKVITECSLLIQSHPALPAIPEGKKRRPLSTIKINGGNVFSEGAILNENDQAEQTTKKQKKTH